MFRVAPQIPTPSRLRQNEKSSGGTRSNLGRLSRDTFASLKKTCRKLGVSFWVDLNDRITSAGQIPALPELMRQRALMRKLSTTF